MRNLAAAHLLPSLQTLNKVGDEYQARAQKPYLYSALFERYLTPVVEGSAIGKAYQSLVRLDKAGQKIAPDAITPRDFLERLLTLRQLQWESNPHQIETKLRNKLLPILRPALVQLLTLFTPFFRYGLRYIERVDRDGEDWVYTMVEYPGAEGKASILPDPFRERSADGPTFKPNRLYLCSAQNHPLVNLHPLLISHFYELFFLEFVGEEKKILYNHCSSPKRYSPPDYYRFLSTRFNKDVEDEPVEDNLVENLQKANDELEKAESGSRTDQMPLDILLSYLSDDARVALEIGLGEALRIGRFWLGLEFFLMGLSKQENGFLSSYLSSIGIDPGSLRGGLRGMAGVAKAGWRKQRDVRELGAQAFANLQEIDAENLAKNYKAEELLNPAFTPRMLAILRQAIRQADGKKVGSIDLLRAALQHPQSLAVNLLLGIIVEAGVDPGEFLSKVEQNAKGNGLIPKPLGEDEQDPNPPVQKNHPREYSPRKSKKGSLLNQIGRDLTALANDGQLNAAIGDNAHKAMVQMGRILQQTQANNPILLGDPGVGKTAIVEGFAWRLAVGDQHGQPVIDALSQKQITDLPPAALLAGTKYRGDLEERLQALLAEVKASAGQTIIFIDEIHTILGGKAEGGLGTISDILKPALARGEFPCIGATTVAEYRQYIESDPALARRFTPVWIEEPSPEETIEIAMLVAKQRLEPSHGVRYPKAVIEEAVNLAVRYLHDEFLPGKVVKLLDQAGPRVTMGVSLRGVGEDDMTQQVGGVVEVEAIRQIVSERTGIPLTRLSEDEG